MGIFEIWQEKVKFCWKKWNTSLIRDQPKALVPYGVGWVPIFHGIDEERDEHEEPKGEKHGDTQETDSDRNHKKDLPLEFLFPHR